MKCPHAESTTMLWIYGEGEESHTSHVADCEECRSVLDVHETVAFQMSKVSTVTDFKSVVEAPSVPKPANTGWIGVLFGVAGVAVAVAALFLAWIGLPNLSDIGTITPDDIAVVNPSDNSTSSDPKPAPKPAPKLDLKPQPEVVAQATAHWDFDGFVDDWDDSFEAIEEELAMLEEELSSF